MQTLGTLHFLSLKDKQSVSIQHGRKSQGTNSKMFFVQKICLYTIHCFSLHTHC